MKRAAHSNSSRLLLLLTCVPLWGGCAALGTMDTADTVPRGKTRLNLQGWVQGVDDGRKPEALPQIALSGRAGVADGVDVGGRGSLQGVEGSVKVQFVGWEEGAPFVMSVVPTVGAVLLSHAWEESDWKTKTQLYAALPVLLAGRNPEDGSQLVFGLRPTWMRFEEIGDSVNRNVLGMGVSLGYAFRVSAGLRVMPEVAAMMPVAERVEHQWVRLQGEPSLQVGLAFLMDAAR